LVRIKGVDYFITYLNGGTPGNKGGNSILLKLYESQSIDVDNVNYGEPNMVLKISKSRKSNDPNWASTNEKRFLKEIEALTNCEKECFQNVVRIYHSGVCRIKNWDTGKFDNHLYYTMEFAEYDLKGFIENSHDSLSLYEKLNLCLSLCEGLRELRSLGYYHRDIKPDNIFMIDDVWKIGDLGLLSERNRTGEIDKVGEPIGPKGWMTPESMNKYLCEGKSFTFNHDCVIDHQSDIFQLGKVFWYIFQYNAPLGSVKERDFLIKNAHIYAALKTMLSYSKKRRFKNIDEVIKLLKIVEADLFKKMAA
jgi:serine/threonine protein kinase